MANAGPSNGATKRMAFPQFRTAIHRRARQLPARMGSGAFHRAKAHEVRRAFDRDRKSTRLNSSHLVISYAVFCLKKKKKIQTDTEVLYRKSILLNSSNVVNPDLSVLRGKNL